MLLLHVVVSRRLTEGRQHLHVILDELVLNPISLHFDLLPADGGFVVVVRLVISVLLVELSEGWEVFWQWVLVLLNVTQDLEFALKGGIVDSRLSLVHAHTNCG